MMKFNYDDLQIKLYDYIFGYKVRQITYLNEINSIFYLLIHEKTRAQHIHIENKDNENTFGVAFKTVPTNSRGIAHILEHTVLCGSLNFPVRDPFFSMLKRSLSTFMNAFTSSDWTMYPFSTQNKKDYYNLMAVYIDSVFFPIIDELSFKQEGCRIDFEDSISKNLVYKGIVYNEMKGAMSSPDQVMIRSLHNALYPNTTYSNNSGGDPKEIPLLTHKALKQFHKKCYHPSNSFFYTYGNLPLEDHLKYIDEKILSHFNYSNPNIEVPNQPRWNKPKALSYYYPLSKHGDHTKKNQICIAWLTADIKNTFEVLVLSILEQILLGNAASPLKKALMDSKLGSALSDGTGFDSDNRDTMFSCGIKDVYESDANKIENIIFETLNSLINQGIKKSMIDSVLHKIEFGRKEITNIPYPFGIKLLMSIASCWFHGGDPEKLLQFDEDLKKIKKYISKGPFFESKIKQYFTNNKHRVLLTLKPNQDMEKNEIQRVKEELLKIKKNMTKYDLDKIAIDAKKLDKLRQKDENLNCLPTLQMEDIPDKINIIDSQSNFFDNYDIVGYDQSTSGILYFSGLFGIGSLEIEFFPLIPFFCHTFSRVGTKIHDYVQIAQNIDLYTGGINLVPHSHTMFNSNGVCIPFISLNSKCLIRNKNEMFNLVQEIINQINFNDSHRMTQLLLEYKAGIESIIVNSGHNLAINLASRNFSNTNYLNYLWSGVAQLHTINSLIDEIVKHGTKKLSGKLLYIAQSVFSSKNFRLALIGDKYDIFSSKINVECFFQSISKRGKDCFQSTKFDLDNKYVYEGWATSTSVSFVAQTFKTVTIEHDDSPSLAVISKILRSMYLHKEIREKGGAYGGFTVYNSETGLFTLCSYRDPHIIKTLEVYNNVSKFIESLDLKNEDIKEAILQNCAEIDKPDSPSTAAKKDFLRKTIGLDDKTRQNYKTSLLNLNKKTVMQVANKYFCCEMSNKSVAIVSNEKLLRIAKKDIIKPELKIKLI